MAMTHADQATMTGQDGRVAEQQPGRQGDEVEELAWLRAEN